MYADSIDKLNSTIISFGWIENSGIEFTNDYVSDPIILQIPIVNTADNMHKLRCGYFDSTLGTKDGKAILNFSV